MNVSELIKQLNSLPAEYRNAEVVVSNSDVPGEYLRATSLGLIMVEEAASSAEILRQGGALPAVEIQRRPDRPF